MKKPIEQLPLAYQTKYFEELKRFDSLNHDLKKEAINRAVILNNEIASLKTDKNILALSRTEYMRAKVQNQIPFRMQESNTILRLLYDNKDRVDDDQKDLIEQSIIWFERVMRSQDIELLPIFSPEEMTNYWLPYLSHLGVVRVSNDDTEVDFEIEYVTEVIIWHMAQARAYCIYGIHLGYDDVSRDHIGKNLESFKKALEIDGLALDLEKEIDDLLELIYFRMSMDDGEGPLIDWLEILSGINKRSVSNASVIGQEDGYLIPVEENKRKHFTVASSEKWLQSRKKNKYMYHPSIRYPGEHHWDGHIKIPVRNIDDIELFIKDFQSL